VGRPSLDRAGDRLTSDRFDVRSTTDAAEYRAVVAPLVERDPVLHSVLASNVDNAVAVTVPDALWMWLEASGAPVAAAMHTPPRPPHLASESAEEGVRFADFLAGAGREVTGVGGLRAAAVGFATRWRELTGCAVSTAMEQGVYVFADPTAPTGVPGALRAAAPAEARLLNAWAAGFTADIRDGHPPAVDVLTARIDRGEMWVWDDAQPVSMTYTSPAHGGVSRISWVYTPPALRGNGYASACVYGASVQQVARGHRCMLYTDLANPTSNAIYQAVGYRRHGDSVLLAFEGSAAAVVR